jgi:Sugar transferases involved in lipopolysaccharide synthesis
MYKKLKWPLGFFVAILGIVFLSPLFLVIICFIKCDSKGPILFKQKRIGKNEDIFEILKFRTMYIDTPKDIPTHLLQNPEARITKVGKFLRKTSLDELPQLLNIIKGEMCFVGPRPALWNQYDLIEERNKYGANNIMPGLTGWAQVNGRDELPIPIKAELDGFYVQNISLGLDVKILIKTATNVIFAKGVVEGQK